MSTADLALDVFHLLANTVPKDLQREIWDKMFNNMVPPTCISSEEEEEGSKVQLYCSQP